MKNRTDLIVAGALTVLILLAAGCAGTPRTGDIPKKGNTEPVILSETADFSRLNGGVFWDTWPDNGVPLFFGGAKRLGNRDDEWDSALEAASLAAAVYHRVVGLSRFYTEKTSRGQGYSGDFQFDTDRELWARLKDELEIVSRVQDHQGSYVIVRYPEGEGIALPPAVQGNFYGNPPGWIRELPRFPGYLVSLGTAQRRQYLPDSVFAADKQALEEMIKQLSLEFTGQRNTIETDGGSGQVQSSLEIARAEVRGFYILARWQSPDGNLFYSLGICREYQNTKRMTQE